MFSGLKAEKLTVLACLVLIAILLLFEFSHNFFIESTIHFSLHLRATLVVLYLLPMSLLLGFFFPAGMIMMSKISTEEISWFWGINGISSVVGSTLSIVIAMSFGFSDVIYVAMLLCCCMP